MDDMMMAMTLAEGFPDQRLSRLTPDSLLKTEGHPLLKGLSVTAAGRFLSAAGHGIRRPDGIPEAVLILCHQGEGQVSLGRSHQEREETLRPGEVVLLPPGVPHGYHASARNPWTIEWAHFKGDETEAWVAHLSPHAGIPIFSAGGRFLAPDAFGQILENLEKSDDFRHLVAASAALRVLLARLSMHRREGRDPLSSGERVARVLAWMRENPTAESMLGDLALMAGLSAPHFAALFRQQTGRAPHDFHRRIRMREGARLLATTALPVLEVASRLGYRDPLYFSRVFRKVHGVSPEAFRRNVPRDFFPGTGIGGMAAGDMDI